MPSTDPYVKLARQTQRMTLPAAVEMAPMIVSLLSRWESCE